MDTPGFAESILTAALAATTDAEDGHTSKQEASADARKTIRSAAGAKAAPLEKFVEEQREVEDEAAFHYAPRLFSFLLGLAILTVMKLRGPASSCVKLQILLLVLLLLLVGCIVEAAGELLAAVSHLPDNCVGLALEQETHDQMGTEPVNGPTAAGEST